MQDSSSRVTAVRLLCCEQCLMQSLNMSICMQYQHAFNNMSIER